MSAEILTDRHFQIKMTSKLNILVWMTLQRNVFTEKVMNQLDECLFIFVFIFTVPPNIVDETSSGDTLATEGRAVTLHCDATGTPR